METSYRYNNKVCRICLEEGIFTSLFSSEFTISPAIMLQTLNLRVFENDSNSIQIGICNQCYYRLSLAYHFKQQCESSEVRLRQYFGIRYYDTKRDVATNTTDESRFISSNRFDSDDELLQKKFKPKRRSRYKAKTEPKKRGPKPTIKAVQTCFNCNKTFKCAAQLQMHLRIHTGEKPYQCDYCLRRFAQKHNLVIHVRTHTGEKPFQCEICSKQFSAHGNFIAHKKIHSGVRDHQCPVCTKMFITSSDLSRHLSTHTGIKNYQCDVCNKAFSRNRDMVLHKRKIHLNERSPAVKCPECRKVFPTDDSLQLHLVKDHHQVPVAPEIPPDIAPQQQQIQQPIHNLHGPPHLHPHHQPFIQPPPPLLPPAVGYQHGRLHPY